MATAQRRRALVTGSNRGIGGAVCAVLAREGWDLVTAAHRHSPLFRCSRTTDITRDLRPTTHPDQSVALTG